MLVILRLNYYKEMKDLVTSRRIKIALMVESGQFLKQNMRGKDDSEEYFGNRCIIKSFV